MKGRLGIKKANCGTCAYLGTETDGNYVEFAIEWPICEKVERYQYLKSFPFKKEMPCWEPEFWHSKQAGLIKTGSNAELKFAIKSFVAARDSLPHSYLHMWT